MKKRKLTVCLLAGVLILAVSAGAAFGSVNGYAAYKNGVKALFLECNNVSLAGSVSISVDGKEVMKSGGEMTTDGTNDSTHYWEEGNGTKIYETHSSTVDGKNISYTSSMAEKTYYSREVDSISVDNLLSYDKDDELERRVVNFMELAADTVMGDLKNNFVSLGKDGDVERYQVNISENQVPALINAGLSLIAYSQANDNYTSYQVSYEDYDESLVNYYEQTTGKAIPQELQENYLDRFNQEWVDNNRALVDEFDEVQSSFTDKKYDLLEEKGSGVLYVHADNSTDYYANQLEFVEAHPEECEDHWSVLVGEELTLESVNCTFGLDKQGRLVENSITANFATTDVKGNAHSFSFSFEATAKDYGTTVVKPLDVTGWRDLSTEEPDKEAAETTAE